MERDSDISYPGRPSQLSRACRNSTFVSKTVFPDRFMQQSYSNDHPLQGYLPFTRDGINTSTNPTLSQALHPFVSRYYQQNSHAVEGCGSSTSTYPNMDSFGTLAVTQHIMQVVHSEANHDALKMSQSEEPLLNNVDLSNGLPVRSAISKYFSTPSIDESKAPWESIRRNYEYSWTPDESIVTTSQPSFDLGPLDIKVTQSILETLSEMNDDSSSSRRASETSMGSVPGYLHSGMFGTDHSTRRTNQRDIESLM